MKKIYFFFLILILLSLWIFSCQKEEVDVVNTLNEVMIANTAKGKQTGTITIKVGHSEKNCKGCVIDENGQNVHIECSGYGTLCEITARVSI